MISFSFRPSDDYIYVMKKLPELLAPAGNLDTAITAFNSGADAVYAGLFKFNARERTENFTIEDFGKLMYYAGKNDKKVYLTFNTLIKENEILEAFDNLKKVTRLLPDAIIVQDLGAVHMLKNYFPHIPIHASTQMGIHNHSGVNMAKKMGMERVILERQLTLDEIKLIKDKSDMELEVFIHGALCCSLSGVCLFSSWMGGWSGNRGKCKQPCRRRYFSKNGNGFFFSTQDLYSLEHIPQLVENGIDSLKIEGRLRKSDYVESVVSAYRLMLDHGKEAGVLSEAKNILSGSLGRRWSHGFASQEDINTVIDPTRLGVSGKQCGKVISLARNGFNMTATSSLYIGDKIRVQAKNGDEGPAITLTRMAIKGTVVKRLPTGQQALIFCDKEVAADGLVFKIGRTTKDNKKICEQLPVLTDRIDLDIHIGQEQISVTVLNNSNYLKWDYSHSFQAAVSKPLDIQSVETEFLKSGNEQIRIRKSKVIIDGNYYISQRDFRHLRQEFSNWLCSSFHESLIPSLGSILPETQALPLPIEKTLGLKECKSAKADNNFQRLAARRSGCSDGDYILPAYCFENDLASLKDTVADMIHNGQQRFRITSLFHLDCFPENSNLELISHFPIPVTNSLAARELIAQGVQRVQLWPELEKPVLDQLCSVLEGYAELYIYGCIPVLQTRAALPVEGAIQDGRGAEFYIEKDFPITYLYPESYFDMSQDELPHVSTYTDKSRYAKTRHSSRFNLDRELV